MTWFDIPTEHRADRRRGAALAKVVADEDEEDTLQTYEDFAITAEVIATAIRKRSKPV